MYIGGLGQEIVGNTAEGINNRIFQLEETYSVFYQN